jgi:hypothetical protein
LENRLTEFICNGRYHAPSDLISRKEWQTGGSSTAERFDLRLERVACEVGQVIASKAQGQCRLSSSPI